jgi:hypothetical protein
MNSGMNTAELREIDCFCRIDVGLCASDVFRASTTSLSGTYDQTQQDSSNSQGVKPLIRYY